MAARRERSTRDLPIGVLAAVGSVAAAVGVGKLLTLWLRLPNLSMIFLIAVLFCAARFGVRSAIVAGVLSFFAYDFFFIPPLYEFTISRAAGILRARHLPDRRHPGRLARRPRARPGAAGARKRPDDALVVRTLAQAFRRRRARRHPAGGDRLCAEDAQRALRRDAAARGRRSRPQRPPGRRSTRSTRARPAPRAGPSRRARRRAGRPAPCRTCASSSVRW